MVQYLVNLNAISYMLTVGLCANQIRWAWYRLVLFAVLMAAWIIPQAKNTWVPESAIDLDLRCFDRSQVPKFGSNGQVSNFASYGNIVFIAMIFFLALAGWVRRRMLRHEARRRQAQAGLEPRTGWTRFVAGAETGLYALVKGYAYYLFILWGFGLIVTNIKWLRELRGRFIPYTGQVENEWGYGQVLAMAILIAPSFEFAAAMYCKFTRALDYVGLAYSKGCGQGASRKCLNARR